MRILLSLLLIVGVLFRGMPAALVTPRSLITASHDEFWSSSMDSLRSFFSSLENIIGRVEGDEGERFSTHIPYVNDALSESVSAAINTLTMAKINEILAAGNERVIKAVLENGFKYCFRDWTRINLSEIPGHLIASFPIEFMPMEAFSVLELDSVVECVLARVEESQFKQFHSLILKLSPEFWKVPRVRSNFSLRMLMTGFHLGTFESFQLATSAASYENLQEMYPSPQCDILEFILNLDILEELKRDNPVSEEIYVQIFRQFPFYFYVLQTFLHEILMMTSQGALLQFIVDKSVSIQHTIGVRREKFPEEARNLASLKSFFSMRFSEYLNSPTLYNFFSISGSNMASLDEIFGLLARVINPANPEVVLSVFIMTTAMGMSTSESLIMEICDDLRGDGKLLEPFKHDSNLIFSFSHCLRRNRFITENVIRNFGRSKARGRDIYILSRILADDFEHLKIIMRDSERGIQRQLKFSTIFAGAFADSALQPHDPESRLNQYTRSHQTPQLTWALDQVPVSSEKFGAKMKQKRDMSEPVTVLRRKKRGFHENETEATAKALFEKSIARRAPVSLSSQFVVPNISNETTARIASSTDEYAYVNQLKPRKQGADDAVAIDFDKVKADFPEIRFIYSVLAAIGKSMVFPAEKLNFSIEESRVSGDGILKDSLATFGQLISLPKFKTVEFKESVDGFVPFPLLCPNVMAFLGAWTALCLKHEVPLTLTFAPIFRKFLFRAVDPEDEGPFVDEMIEKMFADLFKVIRTRFEDEDATSVEILPKMLKSHRMFRLPPPFGGDASPFLLENLFLEMQGPEIQLAPLLSEGSKNLDKYLAFLKFSLKKHLYEGREQFMRHFSVYFKRSFVPFLKHSLIDEFVRGNRVVAADVSASLYFDGEQISVRNDFEGEDGADIYPLDLMKLILSKLSQEQVERFLWFVSGSSFTPLNGFDDYRIAFNVKAAASGEVFYSFARVCFHRFTLVLHENSAQRTFHEFVKSITFSSGFSSSEV